MSTSDDDLEEPVEPTRIDVKALPKEPQKAGTGMADTRAPAAPGDEDVDQALAEDSAEAPEDDDFPQSKTVIERLPIRAEPKAALESWSNDLPHEDEAALAPQPLGDTHILPQGARAAMADGAPADPDSAPEALSEPTHGDAVPPIEVDDGWGGPSLTGLETASHSLKLPVDADETGSLSSDVAEEAMSEARASAHEQGEAPRLVCIDGPDQGKEFVLTGRDVSVGRGPENDIVINDNAMSRVHCRILVSTDAVIVTDQRSANGTIVNGRKIDRATVTSGSTIKLGGSLFRFIEMGDVIKSTEIHLPQESQAVSEPLVSLSAPSDHRNRQLAFGIIGVAGLVALLIVVSSLWSSLQQRQPAQKPEEMAETAFSAGVAAMQAKQVDEALRKFRQAQEAKPDKRFADHIALAEKERANIAALAAAQQAANKGQLGALQTAMATVSRDTTYINELTGLQLRLMQLRDMREHDAEVLLAKKKWSTTDEETASVVAGDLRAVDPESSRARALSEHAHAALTPAPKPVRQQESHPVIERVEVRESHVAAASDVESKALKQFSAGQIDTALATLSAGTLSEGATSLKNKILKFQDVYAQAKTQAQGKQPGAAATVKKALAFELKIAGGGSRYAQELKGLQADADADAASQALNEQRFSDAYRLLKEAVTLSPGHPVATKKLSELSGRARDLFNQGYILKDSDLKQAREKWKAVLAMVPPEDEAYQKAKKWMDQTK